MPQAFFLNQPALAVQGGKPGESFSLAGLDAPNVVLETIKRAEDGDGAIVRMYECENSLTNVTLTGTFLPCGRKLQLSGTARRRAG